MYKTRFFLNLIVILTLVFVTLGTSPITAQAGNGNDGLKADPRLLQMAETAPEFDIHAADEGFFGGFGFICGDKMQTIEIVHAPSV